MCTDNVVYILDCDYVTCNSDKCNFLLGALPIWVRIYTETSSWSMQTYYHPLIHNFSDITNEMCGWLITVHDGPLCSKCKNGFSSLVYSYNLKCIAVTTTTS